MQYSELIERLKRLDEDAALLSENYENLKLVIVGGSALILMNYITRATHDIDVVYCSPELRELMEKYNINDRVQAYINNFPYNFEDRFVRMNIETKVIEYYTASLEDIVIAKLCSHRRTDREDILQPFVIDNVNWDKLEKLSEELKMSILNDSNYADFVYRYTE